jgi:hypothetical protein
MSVQKILQESIEKNPLDLKEAFVEELRARLGLALEAKMYGEENMSEEVELDENHESLSLSDLTLEELEDFMKTEEFEQLDEISMEKLKSYHKAAKSDADTRSIKHVEGTGEKGNIKKFLKRKAGMDLAVHKAGKKVMDEEVEQIDEISTPKLARYMKRASDDLANNSANREFMKANLPSFTDKDERTKEKVDNTFKKMISKRKAGIGQAASKIARKHSED